MKKTVFFFFVLISCGVFSQQHDHGAQDEPSTHGMAIFGRNKIYAYHLPMFRSPHDYQIVLELVFDERIRQQFIRDQQEHPEHATYTIEPEKFILPEMIANPRPFRASIYRGHFERGGIKIAESVAVRIQEVIYFKKLSPNTIKPKTTDFILFGNNREQFAVHSIAKAPDFDQILQIKTGERLDTYKIFTFDETVNAPIGVSGNTIEVNFDGRKLKVDLLRQLYLEFEDLKN
ncbi:hypothetical protein [Flavobacterium sp. ABG]|uniref:hypothetical protein n=1 Tax=Flavobacterium sp. ABG TaxID=1423322 RepID=UPI000649461A|nr:hypothetical protein [Flavobacterium sp. ABG]KLT69687.1 hypothetical protein AB674_10490 [Flavobacterium sp. ABG]